jgi:hypothetical protein
MKKLRLPFEICLLAILFAVACSLSVFTCAVALIWMTLGVMSIGHRPLASFPTMGLGSQWRRGYRAACLWFYHLARWPWHVQPSL